MKLLLALALSLTAFAAPAAAHEDVDYFAYGRAELSPQGYQMARSVAQFSRSQPVAKIRIDAHMDTAEAAEFSQELSRRRAQAVASELVALGVSPEIIEMNSYGATRLARPTAANVAEALNRRAAVGVNFVR